MSILSTFNATVGPGLNPTLKPSQVRSSNWMPINKTSAPPTTSHQLRANEENLDLKEIPATVSRRGMMGLAGLSLAMVSVSSPKPAEARMTRAEMKNKILEKFKELREKFGVSKLGEEGKEQTSEPSKDSEPQQDYFGEQKMFAYPGDEGKDGENSVLQTESKSREESAPEKDKSPILPFLDLTEVNRD